MRQLLVRIVFVIAASGLTSPAFAQSERTESPATGQHRTMSAFGARTVRPGQFLVDSGIGYPYWFNIRAVAGVWQRGGRGLDLGLGVRTYFSTWDFQAHLRFQLYERSALALGIFGTVDAGGGFNGRNTFGFQAGGIASLHIRSRAALSLRGYLETWSDRLCAAAGSQDVDGLPNSGPRVCGMDATAEDLARARELVSATISGPMDLQRRDTGARLYLSVASEVSIGGPYGLYALVEGAPFQDARPTYTDLFTGAAFRSDPGYRFQLGATAKF